MRPCRPSPRFALLALSLIAATAALVATTSVAQPESATTSRPRPVSAGLPLLFEPTADASRYVARGAGYQFVFTRDRVELLAGNASQSARVGLRFTGSRSSRPVAESAQSARVNYLVGDTPSWRTNIPTYGNVRYPAIYDGIDALFYGNGRQLEYDLVVAPHADITAIEVAFDGIDAARLDPAGDLVLRVGTHEVRQSQPIAYQVIHGVRRAVPARYELRDRAVRFAIGDYDRRVPLVIDPVFIYSTLYGGSDSDGFADVAVDASGAAYVAGQTFSTDFAGTPQPGTPPQSIFANVVVVKLDRHGRVVYSTIFGGSEGDLPRGIAVDLANAAYVVGWTTSMDFPTTTGALQRTRRGGSDLFVAKLAPAGNRLVYATLFGGSGAEDFSDIAVNAAGQAYVAGTTNSGDLPVTAGALDTVNTAGNFSGFAAKLNAAGSALVYGTYLTGQDQWATAIALDSQDRAIIAGSIDGAMPTTFTNGPLGGRDAYVIALNENGSRTQYATRFGGSGSDDAAALALGQSDNVFLAGTTNSPDLPVDPREEGNTLRGSNDAYLAYLAGGAGSLVQARYFGGSGGESVSAISATEFTTTLLGTTSSSDLPTRGALQSTRGSAQDGFVANFQLMFLRWSTYLGGSANDFPHGMAVDAAGSITVVGETQSVNYPLVNAVDRTGAGGSGNPYEGFITRFATVPRGTPGPVDVTVHVADRATLHGNWVKQADSSAAGGYKLRNPDHGAAKITRAKAAPADYFEFTIDRLIGDYRIWVRARADHDSYTNDSVYLQFSYADSGVDDGGQLYPIGSTIGMPIVLEACSGCGVHGWGWANDTYGRSGISESVHFYPDHQPVTVRVQAREDGISIDQIVFARMLPLDPGLFYTWAPGYEKDDDTIVTENVDTRHQEIVLVGNSFKTSGAWRTEVDGTVAGWYKLHQPDAGAPKLTTPLANPVNYVERTFDVIGGIPYRLWIRGHADADYWGNDSAYVQFSGSVTASGTPTWRIGSTSATDYVLENCGGCGVQGWGWNDNGYGTGVLGQLVYFAQSGPQTIRIQTREDGLAIDQVVLSAHTYLSQAPGSTKNDTTILVATQD